MFVGEHSFIHSFTHSNTLKERVEQTLSSALKWFNQNRLKINPSKTEMIILKSSRLKSDDFCVHFGNDQISPSSGVKVLGVTIDPHLAWDKHVTSVVQRCYMVLVGLARMRHRLPKETKRLLIEALVFPHVRYCISVWGNCTATQKQRIQKAINFGARIVTGLGRRERVTPVLLELGWGRVDDVLLEHDISIMRRLLTSTNAPEILRNRIVSRSDVSVRSTRATDDGQLELPRYDSTFAQRGFIYRATKSWNKLPTRDRQRLPPPATEAPSG